MTVAQQTNPRSYPDATPRKVAFLGLGVMGWPMAGHLALAGHTVTVFNRTAAKAQAWRKPLRQQAVRTMPARRAKQPKGPISSSCASATMTTCAAWCWGLMVLWRACNRAAF